MRLQSLFDPYEGENVREWAGCFVVYVPYVDHEPIVVPWRALADQIEAAIDAAYESGIDAGQSEF